MAYHLQHLKFVIVTLGAAGCVMLQRTASDSSGVDAMDVNMVYEALVNEIEGQKKSQPFVVSSKVALLRKKSDDGKTPKEITGRILVGTAEDIQSSELVDTTGSGDAFIGSVLYALCAGLPPEKMLVLGAIVAGANCRALGARGGLPQHSDSRVLRVIQSEL